MVENRNTAYGARIASRSPNSRRSSTSTATSTASCSSRLVVITSPKSSGAARVTSQAQTIPPGIRWPLYASNSRSLLNSGSCAALV